MRISLALTFALLAAHGSPSQAAKYGGNKPKVSKIGKSQTKGSRRQRRTFRNQNRLKKSVENHVTDVEAKVVSQGKRGYRVEVGHWISQHKKHATFDTQFVRLQPGQWLNAGTGENVSYRVGVSKKGKALTEYTFTQIIGARSNPTKDHPQAQNSSLLYGVLLDGFRTRADGKIEISGHIWRPYSQIQMGNMKTEAKASAGITTRATGLKHKPGTVEHTAGRVHFEGVIPAGTKSISLGSFAGQKVDVHLNAGGLSSLRVVVPER